jgi:hypothetical protein
MAPPRHTKLRSLVSKGFTPRQVARLNDHVADMACHIGGDRTAMFYPSSRMRDVELGRSSGCGRI